MKGEREPKAKDRVAAKLQVLAELADGLGQTQDHDALLALAVKSAREAFEATHVAVFEVEGDTLLLAAYEGRGSEEVKVGYEHPLEGGILGHVVRTKEAYLANDVAKDPLYMSGYEDAKAEFACPIFVEGHLAAVLDVESGAKNAFDERDVAFLKLLAAQFGAAIRHAGTLAQSRRRKEEVETILDLSRRTLESLDTAQVLALVAEAIEKKMGYHHVLVFLRDEETGEMVLRASAGAAGKGLEVGYVLPRGEGLTGWVATHGEPVYVPDVSVDDRYLAAISASKSTLALPILTAERVVGVITVESQRLDGFNNFDQRVLTTLAEEIAKAVRNARHFRDMRRARDQMGRVADFFRAVAGSLSPEAILDVVVGELPGICGIDRLSVFLADPARKVLRLHAHNGPKGALPEQLEVERTPDSLLWKCLESGEDRVVQDLERELAWSRRKGFRTPAFAVLVLRAGNRALGVITAADPTEAERFTADQARLLGGLASQIGTALSNAIQYEQTVRLSQTDDLTGLWRRRYFEPALRREVARCKRLGTPLSVVMLDLDKFKEINDTHGHAVGDEVLKEVSMRSRDVVRQVDIVGRYGGDEFVIILPDTPPEAAAIVGDRLLEGMADRPIIAEGVRLNLTVSIGLASSPPVAVDYPEDILAAADKALYEAKQAGRNRVAVASA